MTGVVKSNRCGTCRDRKVKCDEAKPVCGPCQKRNRVCKDPISKVKFAKPKGISADVAREGDDLIEPLSHISILRSVPTTEGGTFQTMRIGRRRRAPAELAKPCADESVPLLRSPSLSPIELIQLGLLQSYSLTRAGLRLSMIANFMGDMPRMLGQSTAFDDSIACLVNCHDLILRGLRPSGDTRQANLYAKALLSLQAALKDPVESYSDLTLGAVTILGNVEIFGGGSNIPQNVQHAGGACKLIEMRGSFRTQSNFTKTLYMTQRGLSILVAMHRNEECFFNEPEWREISFIDLFNCETDFIVDELIRELTALPALLVKTRSSYYSSDETVNNTIYQEALQLRNSLSKISGFVDIALHTGLGITETPSVYADSLLPTSYQFSSLELSNACTFFWGASIILNTIIARFLPADTPPSILNDLQDQCLLARQRIFMSCEYAQQFRPIGAMRMCGPVIMAYRGATDEERSWIINQLRQIGELVAEPEVVWSPISLEYASRFFYGEPLTPPTN